MPAAGAAIALVFLLAQRFDADAGAAPLRPPAVLSLDAESPETARLTWEAPGLLVRLCVNYDRERRQPYACFGLGMLQETAVGVPPEDRGYYLLSLQACSVTQSECSDPKTLATQIDKPKKRFALKPVANQ